MAVTDPIKPFFSIKLMGLYPRATRFCAANGGRRAMSQ